MHVSFPQRFLLRTLLRPTVGLLLLVPGLANAQSPLRTEVVATGLQRPVGFVQDPSDPATQYIPQHGGRIRVLRNGRLQGADFLDLSGAIVNSGEQGLLGLAFPPDYGATGRFYVSFSAADFGQGSGHTVVARFHRSTHDPLVADLGSRFDLQWSMGERFIRQTFDLHRSGHLAFGPDGNLYVATGDGGADGSDAGDPLNKAQDLGSLLGKILRIDVGVDDADPNGFRVPSDNPFVNVSGAAPEVWSLGFRNPWQFSFDAATGAMLIGDVGHDRYEEIDYQPAGQGGRNYGWRIREGTHDYNPSLPPAFFPLRDPVFEFDHSVGRSIIGGVVYRGRGLPGSFVGRYVFADFVARRLFSLALTIDPATGEATASDFRDHTADLGASSNLGGVSAIGVDAAGEIYLVSLTRGEVLRLTAVRSLVSLDQVTPHSGLLEVSGWAIDGRATSGSGVDSIHLYAFPNPGSGAAPIFLGAADTFVSRPDVAQFYGQQFQQSGFHIVTNQWFPPGSTLIVAYGRSMVTGVFELVTSAYFSGLDSGQFVYAVDQKPAGTVSQPILVTGWALDYWASTAPPGEGTGIRAVFVDILSPTGVLLRTIPAAYGLPRPDVGAIFGSRFEGSGFSAAISDLWPGEFSYRVRYVRGSGSEWLVPGESAFTIQPGPMIAIGAPVYDANVGSTFLIGGWALDLRSSSGPGVDTLHVWAYPNPGSGTAPVFLGVADYGVFRPDVGAVFGPQFTSSGFNLMAGPLAPGIYDVVVFARTLVSGTFEIYAIVRVTVN
jgi:glucose/arabinose dehydrogenase